MIEKLVAGLRKIMRKHKDDIHEIIPSSIKGGDLNMKISRIIFLGIVKL